VLKGISGRATLASVTELERTLAQKDDQEADAEANKDWGVSVAKEAAIPPNVKSSMMEAVLSVDEVQSLATEQGDEGFFSNVFTNRMCSTDGSRQHRQLDSPQHLWHTDGCGDPLLAVVLTLFSSKLDSNLVSSHNVGGFVKVSNFDDGPFTPIDSARHNHPVPTSTTAHWLCFPLCPSLGLLHCVHQEMKHDRWTVTFETVWFVGGRRELKICRVGCDVVGWCCAFERLLFCRGPGRKVFSKQGGSLSVSKFWNRICPCNAAAHAVTSLKNHRGTGLCGEPCRPAVAQNLSRGTRRMWANLGCTPKSNQFRVRK
jgi:hypothetical protein